MSPVSSALGPWGCAYITIYRSGIGMDKAEKNLLQALYSNENRPNQFKEYPYAAIRWLDGKSVRKVRGWIDRDGRFNCYNSFDAHRDGHRDRLSPKFKAIEWIRVLEGEGLVSTSMEGEETIRVALTYRGIIYARNCSTAWGRLNLIYEERKYGIMGILITILVSATTSFFASLIGV